ncbi:DEKNAAC104688 [Brettanomyces naardenensis]|uniref:DEKNAAC104689 n=1 Tax=Brettanomyces naardenensis TaxID=13370 RepID=A0A448YRR7_BRENA|nr:DEKNAAC104688 [Brettanomyces naardenensis]
MNRAPDPFEEWLYRRLIKSRVFNDMVRSIYCRFNNLPPPQRLASESILRGPMKVQSQFDYVPTRLQKFNAFRKIFWEELKNTFLLRK